MTHTAPQPQALDGLRIVDLTRGPAGGLATMMLADFGADVINISPPFDDPLTELAAAPMWQRGKTQLALDLAEASDAEILKDLLSCADVFVVNLRKSSLQRLGLDYTTLAQVHPHLIYTHISAWGNNGPMADVPGYEHLVAALAGRMQLFTGIVDRPGPVFSAMQVGIHACAQTTTSGILSALFARDNNSPRQGRLVETSLLQGMLPYEQGPLIGSQFPDRFPTLLPSLQPPKAANPNEPALPPMPSLYYHPAQAADGRWMQFGNLLPHLFDNFLINTDLMDVLADPDFNAKQLLLPAQKQDAFRERMLKRIQDRSVKEWMAQLIADGGVVAGPYQTTQEALGDPDIVANGHVVETDDGGLQLGPVAKLTRTPARPGARASVLQSAQAKIAEWRQLQQSKDQQANISEKSQLPLRGLRVVELATIIAAPFGASFLADMGADVIKVEQIGGDPYRSMGAGIGSARVNAGKRSISINLKSAEGQKIVADLLATADVVIHNYRPGVPERLGISYEQVIQNNPNVIYLQCNGYGPSGPSALRPSTHPIPGAAMGGVMYQMGENLPRDLQNHENLCLWTRRIMRANEVNPDPNTALVVATSVMLGVVARQRTGIGQQIFIDMFGANAYANHDDFLSYAGKPKRLLADKDMLGLSPVYRLYQCADQHWIFLAIPTHSQQVKFCQRLSELDLSTPSIDQLKRADQQTADQLASLFASRSASQWANDLCSHGIGCVRADAYLPSEFWLENEQVKANHLGNSVNHPIWGEYQRHGAMLKYDDQDTDHLGPPLAGQHNAALLTELNYSAEEYQKFIELGVLWAEEA